MTKPTDKQLRDAIRSLYLGPQPSQKTIDKAEKVADRYVAKFAIPVSAWRFK